MKQDASSPQGQHVRFLFDPVCPWSWRASLWIRAVARVRPLTVQWDLLSLAHINRSQPANPMLERQLKSRHALRLLAKARESEGSDGVGRLYLAIGRFRHEEGRELDDEGMLEAALAGCGLPIGLLEATRNDEALDQHLEAQYEDACRGGAFGVPTIYVNHSDLPFYGPVIDPVPPDDEAGALWDVLSRLCQKGYFFEIKRSRG